MALSIYSPPFESNVSGTINGSCMQVGLEDHIEWYGMNHEIAVDNEGKGRRAKHEEHHPITLVKPMDKASPLLLDTLTKNGVIPKIELKFYRPAASGEEVHYYTITLEEAQIAKIATEQLNNKYPENMAHETRETVSFTYDKITWEEVTAGTMAFASWDETRRGG